VVAETVAPKAVPSQMIAIEVGKSRVKYCAERGRVSEAKRRSERTKDSTAYECSQESSTKTRECQVDREPEEHLAARGKWKSAHSEGIIRKTDCQLTCLQMILGTLNYFIHHFDQLSSPYRPSFD